jgi:hypothetical protein
MKAASMYRTTSVPVLLRTHYDPADDDKMKEWVNKSKLFEDEAWWAP